MVKCIMDYVKIMELCDLRQLGDLIDTEDAGLVTRGLKYHRKC